MSKQHSYRSLVIIVIICLALLSGLIYSSAKQHQHNKNMPKIARKAKLKQLRKQHKEHQEHQEDKEIANQEKAQNNAKQKQIDNEASHNNISTHKPNKKKLANTHKGTKHYTKASSSYQKSINKNRMFMHDINADRSTDRCFTKVFIYNPNRHQITVVYNRHGQILMHKKRWHKVKLGINKKLNYQDNQLHRLDHRIHFYVK